MDLSKLPRLSNSGQPANADEPTAAGDAAPNPPYSPAGQPPLEYRGSAYPPPVGVGAMAWLNAILGLLMIMMSWRFAAFLLATVSGHPFHTNINWIDGPKSGQEVKYWELEGHVMLTEAGFFLFGVAAVAEAAWKVLRANGMRAMRPVVAFLVLLAVVATAINIVAACEVAKDQQIPLISGLAVAFGGLIVADLWGDLTGRRLGRA